MIFPGFFVVSWLALIVSVAAFLTWRREDPGTGMFELSLIFVLCAILCSVISQGWCKYEVRTNPKNQFAVVRITPVPVIFIGAFHTKEKRVGSIYNSLPEAEAYLRLLTAKEEKEIWVKPARGTK